MEGYESVRVLLDQPPWRVLLGRQRSSGELFRVTEFCGGAVERQEVLGRAGALQGRRCRGLLRILECTENGEKVLIVSEYSGYRLSEVLLRKRQRGERLPALMALCAMVEVLVALSALLSGGVPVRTLASTDCYFVLSACAADVRIDPLCVLRFQGGCDLQCPGCGGLAADFAAIAQEILQQSACSEATRLELAVILHNAVQRRDTDQLLREPPILHTAAQMYDRREMARIFGPGCADLVHIAQVTDRDARELRAREDVSGLALLARDLKMALSDVELHYIRRYKSYCIPKEQFQLQQVAVAANIKYLDIANSQVDALTLAPDQQLAHLDITSTRIKCLDLSQHTVGELIAARNPHLESIALPADTLQLFVLRFSKVQRLQLSSSCLRHINLAKNEALEELDCNFDQREIDFIEVENYFYLTTNAQYISFKNVNLGDFLIGSYGHLCVLSLINCSLKQLAIDAHSKIQFVSVSLNRAIDLNINSANAIRYLDISSTDVSCFNYILPCLNLLNISNTKILFINLQNYQELQSFLFRQCELREVQCQNLRELQILIGRDSKLEVIELAKCFALQILDLSFTDISDIDISDCKELNHIDLRQTAISSLELPELAKIQLLALDATYISAINYNHIQNVECLYLNYTDILTVPCNLPLLKLFQAKQCNLTGLCDLTASPQLQTIDISETNIEGLKLSSRQLLSIDVSFSRIREVDLLGQPKLQRVIVDSSQAVNIEEQKRHLCKVLPTKKPDTGNSADGESEESFEFND